MAGRGRGGPGRGRGRASVSFNVEQLGFTAGEAVPGPVLQPPPLYPPLERRPVPLQSGSEVEYLLALKREFMGFLRYSPMYIARDTETKDIERYSDYRNLDSINKPNSLKYDWKRLPQELRPQSSVQKKKKATQTNGTPAKKPKKLEDVSKRFDELEKMEKDDDAADDDGGGEEEGNKESKEGETQEGEIEEEEDVDEEMDDGTDYVNNYFDNGESYLDDDDDNLDDGPVYS